MNLASISENKDKEKRIAVTPEIAKKYISLGFNLSLPNNYGSHLGFSDDQYKSLGVSLLDSEEEIVKKSDVIIQLGLLSDEKLLLLNENHKNTWNNFTKFVLWGTVAVIIVLVLMAIFLL